MRTVLYKGAHFRLVPAVHSTAGAFPAAGFIIDIGGTRVYASGDTDLFGDIALIGRRYTPVLAIVSAGDGGWDPRTRPRRSRWSARSMRSRFTTPSIRS
jgi:L-ascorbate metabolism protein UlaG (beta-lactamase superfamily)